MIASLRRPGPSLVLGVVSLVLVACPARRGGLSRDALERADAVVDGKEAPPTIAALLSTRIPFHTTAPDTLRGSAAARAFARGEPIPDAIDGADAELLRCLRADARRDYVAIARSCASFAGLCAPENCGRATAGDDVRAPVAVALLARHVGSFDDDTRRELRERTGYGVERCRAGGGRCALHVVAAAQLRQGLAEALGEERAHTPRREDDAVWIAHAEADGPWLDAEAHFVDAARHDKPHKRHPRFRARRLGADEGRLSPAQGAEPGWYRLTVTGESAAGPATLVITGHGTAAEVRVDGQPVLVRHAGDGGAVIEFIPLTLAAGGHDVEVLFFDRGRGISLALLDDAGRPALRTEAERRWRRPAGIEQRADPGLGALLLPPTLDPADVEVLPHLMVRQAAARLGLGLDRLEQQRTTQALAATFGWSPPAATAAALGIEGDILPDQTLRALAAPLWASVEHAWPDAPLPILARARLAADDEPESALPLYRELTRRAPTYPIGWRELIDELVRQDLVDEAVAAADTLLALGRTAENLEAATLAWRAAGALEQVTRLTDERLRRARSAARMRRRLQQGETTQVLRDLARPVGPESTDDENSDDDSDDDSDDALDLLELLRPELATDTLTRRRTARPDDPGLALREAKHRGDVGAVRALLRRTANLEAVQLAAALGDVPPWLDALQEGDRVIAARRRGPTPWPEAGAITLLQGTERHFAEDGSAFTLRHFVFEVRSKDSIDSIGEIARDDSELIVRLRVVKPDGRELEPEHHAEVKDISLTGLAPGDIVEWVMVAADDGARDGAFWETVSLASASPTLRRRYLASWPATLEATRSVVAVSQHGAPPGVRRRHDDRVELRFEASDTPPMLDEPHAGHRTDDEPQVGIVVDVDEDLYRSLRANRIRGALVRDLWLEQTAVRLAGRGSPRERLERLFRFVATRVVEAPTAEAPATLATGRGQRILLLLALARAAGLDARALAVHGPLDPGLEIPSARAFATLVLRVAVGAPGDADDIAVIAAFDEGLLLDALPPALRGAAVIDLEDGQTGTLPDSAIDDAPVEVIADLRLVVDGDAGHLEGLAVLRLPAPLAESLRPTARAATPEQLERFVESVLAGSLPGATARQVSTPGLDAAGASLSFVADVSLPVDITAPIRFEHLFPGGAAATMRAAPPLSSYARVAQRQRSLLVAPHRERVELTWRLPAEASVVELPPPLDLEAGPFSLRQRASVDEGVVRWERTMESRVARVSPTAWPTVRARLAPLMTASDARVVFVVARSQIGVLFPVEAGTKLLSAGGARAPAG
jgi:hypothetical protein